MELLTENGPYVPQQPALPPARVLRIDRRTEVRKAWERKEGVVYHEYYEEDPRTLEAALLTLSEKNLIIGQYNARHQFMTLRTMFSQMDYIKNVQQDWVDVLEQQTVDLEAL